nr:MAG TPA: ribonucleotide-diphosphate reductase subunit beta [Caudoviricetes sp.]
MKIFGSFSFAERKLMEGNAKIIKLIARKLHCGFYQ